MNKQIRNNSQKAAFVKQQVMYQGPLPTPEAFAGYDNVLPGAAERILSLAENDQKIQKDFLIEEQNRKELLVKNSHSENMAQIKIGKAFIVSLLSFSFILLISGLYMIIFKEDKMGYLLVSPSFVATSIQAIRYIFPNKYKK